MVLKVDKRTSEFRDGKSGVGGIVSDTIDQVLEEAKDWGFKGVSRSRCWKITLLPCTGAEWENLETGVEFSGDWDLMRVELGHGKWAGECSGKIATMDQWFTLREALEYIPLLPLHYGRLLFQYIHIRGQYGGCFKVPCWRVGVDGYSIDFDMAERTQKLQLWDKDESTQVVAVAPLPLWVVHHDEYLAHEVQCVNCDEWFDYWEVACPNCGCVNSPDYDDFRDYEHEEIEEA